MIFEFCPAVINKVHLIFSRLYWADMLALQADVAVQIFFSGNVSD